MRVIILLLLLTLKGFSQKVPKDTLYFHLDSSYIVEKYFLKTNERQTFTPDNYDAVQEKMAMTNSLGYFIFYRDTSFHSTKFSNPKSLYNFVEKKENFYPGRHNSAVNIPKLKNEFIYKYEIFFVDKQKVIKPKFLRYRSYYPIRTSRNVFIPNPKKDSLYFAFNEDDFYDPYNRKQAFKTSFGVKTKTRYEGLELEKLDSIKINHLIKPKSIIEFKNQLESNPQESGIRSIEDFAEYLGNYKVFLIKDKIIYEVRPTYWIE